MCSILSILVCMSCMMSVSWKVDSVMVGRIKCSRLLCVSSFVVYELKVMILLWLKLGSYFSLIVKI